MAFRLSFYNVRTIQQYCIDLVLELIREKVLEKYVVKNKTELMRI